MTTNPADVRTSEPHRLLAIYLNDHLAGVGGRPGARAAVSSRQRRHPARSCAERRRGRDRG